MSDGAPVNAERTRVSFPKHSREVVAARERRSAERVSRLRRRRVAQDHFSMALARPDFDGMIRWFERTTGKRSIYQTAKARADYRASFKGTFFDVTGFLRSIGIKHGFLSIARQHEDYDRLVKYFNGYMNSKYCPRSWAVKAWHYFMFATWQKFPKEIAKQAYALSESVKREMRKKPWNNMPVPYPPPPNVRTFAMPTAIAARYPGFYEETNPIMPAFYEDEVHEGFKGAKYGTYAVARSLGFTPAQAKRIGHACADIDHNGTDAYGDTNDTESRHFNLNRHDPRLPDTRLVWAKRHLDAAVELAKRGAFARAEHELGCGLHSLQDAFAHGQIPLGTHKILGMIPDITEYNPVALYEAEVATRAYLRAYKERIKAFAPPAVVVPRRSRLHVVRI